jgi:hypothetical protein
MKTGKIKTANEQKRMRGVRRKAIAASGILGIVTLFNACPNPTTEYVDRDHYYEVRPTFEQIFKIITSDTAVKDNLKLVYEGFSDEYAIDLKKNYQTIVVDTLPNDSFYTDTFVLNGNLITIFGSPSNFVSTLTDFIENSFKTDSNNKLAELGKKLNTAKETIRLSLGKSIYPQKQV